MKKWYIIYIYSLYCSGYKEFQIVLEITYPIQSELLQFPQILYVYAGTSVLQIYSHLHYLYFCIRG